MEKRKITLGHSPDADDAFMFYALANGCVDTGPYNFEHKLLDIQTLNLMTQRQELDVSAISLHNFPCICGNYSILSSGVSMGDHYGPVLVCKPENKHKSLADAKIAIPGKHTTAFLALRFLIPDPDTIEMPFDRILDAVLEGHADAGLVIHEGQLTYGKAGLVKIHDLGEWWFENYNRPLPLGVNVIHNRFGLDEQKIISSILRESIRYALGHEKEALDYAMRYAGGIPEKDALKFVRMYVNHYTADYGKTGEEAVRFLLGEAAEKGFVPKIPVPVFV